MSKAILIKYILPIFISVFLLYGGYSVFFNESDSNKYQDNFDKDLEGYRDFSKKHNSDDNSSAYSKFKNDSSDNSWDISCKNKNEYAWNREVLVLGESLDMKFSENIIKDLNALSDGCRSKGESYIKYIQTDYLSDKYVQTTQEQKECVNNVLFETQDELDDLKLTVNSINSKYSDLPKKYLSYAEYSVAGSIEEETSRNMSDIFSEVLFVVSKTPKIVLDNQMGISECFSIEKGELYQESLSEIYDIIEGYGVDIDKR